ncbi:hypothetical protein Glove_209g88 [Diversispora epigaea]|uniref:Uncharacterized protein n=1 Tax=Diversispora epigaea TaxID=1348612 RepID=A0A397IIN9_9GLOM|nr:hypothetical protein Glove_209g88 [Diversispora epigaea]
MATNNEAIRTSSSFASEDNENNNGDIERGIERNNKCIDCGSCCGLCGSAVIFYFTFSKWVHIGK